MAGKSQHVLPFNSQAVEKAGTRDGKQTEWRIDGVRGLTLIVTEGGVATYAYRYQVKQGKKRKFRTIKLGRRDAITLHDARKACEEHRREVEKGTDVALERTLKAQEFTLRELFEERKAKEDRRAASTMKGYEEILKADVFPTLGDIPAADIKPEQIVGVLAAIEERSKSLAHRARSALGSTYRFGLKRRLVKLNPTAGLGFIHVSKPRKRVLKDKEIRAIWNGLSACVEVSERMALLLKFCLLTGQREAECAGAQLSEFKLGTANPRWVIPANRMKRKERDQYVPLNSEAVAVIEAAKKLGTRGGYLFPADTDKIKLIEDESGKIARKKPRTPHINRESMSRAMARLTSKLKINDAHGHDFRKALTTWIRENGHSKDVSDLILHHASGSVTGSHYDFAVLDGPVRKALQAWATHVTTPRQSAEIRKLTA
ncbi:tyrosine-type recombinase/integrase [Hyphomicrobium denitrificans]|uniref:tyrosine-type recombinase/integrase n=1 Tax=Hyphomicrobium denitrificans TaxID=53399 RepID=UPI00022E8911|nr:tyrosine-type recombinase/integrase [Hyphomicrobium denitrificans]